MNKTFSAEDLADRWYDRRAIVNLAGKYVTSLLLKREGEIFDRFWSRAEDVCLSFNDGSYLGPEALRAYYAREAENTAAQSRMLKELFPEKLGHLSDEELFGVGQMRGLPITTPVIEIAADGQTAKGLWHVQGAENGLTAYGPLSRWILGFLAIDFRKEGDEWKLWHVLHAEDVVAPMGESWLKPKAREPRAEFAAAAQWQKLPYSVARENYRPYTPDRPFTAPPVLPEAYDTFSNTFSYGIGEAEA